MSVDSVTKFEQYIKAAEEAEMRTICFSEHGNIFNWVKKKQYLEEKGMKYIHANEVYLTEYIDKEKGLIRDNYHYMLISRNWEGVQELNKLTSLSNNQEDGHKYYNPRLSFDDLFNTSDNIIMTSACLASPLWRAIKNDNKQMFNKLMDFFVKNKHRMFFEIQYHMHPEQRIFNQHLYDLSKSTGIPLIAATDTHALNKSHAEARTILMKAKGATYGDEDAFDLTFKTYPEIIKMFEDQNAIPRSAYLEAIHNTNVLVDMVEEFKLDASPKYPKLHDDSEKVFKEKINIGVVERGINKFPPEKKQKYFERIREEFDTYKKVGAIDYMLLQKDVVDWAHKHEIYQGYGRGSVNGSLIAYLLKITEMDSIKHKLNFFRFLNPERISLADIDQDWPPSKRQDVIDYVATIPGIHFSEIITFNTVALKGAIREVGRALNMDLSVVDEIAKAVFKNNERKDDIDSKYREKYPELFKFVDLVQGVIVSIGSHPSGYVVSPIGLEDNIGLCYTKESKYPVSQINMKELDGLNYVKLDILGLDNNEIINEACKLAGIERLVPDNMDVNDENVWNSIRESGLGIFQWESSSAQSYLKDLLSPETIHKIKQQHPDFSYIELFSIGNGAIRPSGDSYRQDLANGIFKDHGHEALNNFLKNTMGYLVYQEQIMNFLVEFCDFSMAESDSVRRGLSKKEGTEKFLPEIRKRFVNKMIRDYDETEEVAVSVLEPFLQVIDSAQFYGFSDNHSNPYSHIGYGNGYLRYYYPLAFLTVMLNINKDDIDKTGQIINYAKTRDIKISPITFGKSNAAYSYNEEDRTIYKGLESIKFLNAKIAEELLLLSGNTYEYFIDLLVDISENTSVNTRQLDILIRLNFFSKYGSCGLLLAIYNEFSSGKAQYKKTYVEKTKFKRLEELRLAENNIRSSDDYPELLPNEVVMFESEVTGYITTTYPNVESNWCVVTDLDTKYSPKLKLYRLKTGEEYNFKMDKKTFNNKDKNLVIKKGDMIEITSHQKKQRQVPDGAGGFKPTDQTDVWITGYTKYIQKETKKNESASTAK
ncbi:DNA polymerase III subunit alpha [Paenibacillus tianjinensis]|uniref:DNA polymerase III subunit alpha n=2 Tax=Paenibacillus tianjinensis TaxID=2810347 RepID=A0ABX7L7W8_9BACL|nr:DNA polymerase III subunit alpha [Paenibacillus tianjinensis]QSF43351.1 DNA polymerase III subunit alpha [Paenibacillus tianjinensis]